MVYYGALCQHHFGSCGHVYSISVELFQIPTPTGKLFIRESGERFAKCLGSIKEENV
jgi:hypothetical protein